ncbi:uncharacterized protein LOC129228331 [Uloborus diversus]|uniref:uncharacterized protein LOC129228331 n=1 Tax=Uloborus diversus TaxID=327109 RepID=UPI002409CC4B|nr:uncharacterized protein LOC129228331 [Uloborus diversus]
MITIVKFVQSRFGNLKEAGRQRILAHDCSGYRAWNKECSEIEIDVLFDRFQITNLTYNPKFESLELFSVIGGYMGMWLGISLVAVYDFIGTVVTLLLAYGRKRRKRRQHISKKMNIYQNFKIRDQFSKNNYRTVWKI